MMSRIRQMLFWCAVALLSAGPAAAQHFPSNDSLTALLRAQVEKSGVGMVLGVMEADGSTRIVSYGNAGIGAKPLGPKSVFEIGSITNADLAENRCR